MILADRAAGTGPRPIAVALTRALNTTGARFLFPGPRELPAVPDQSTEYLGTGRSGEYLRFGFGETQVQSTAYLCLLRKRALPWSTVSRHSPNLVGT